MQLQLAYLLQQVLPLIIFNTDERLSLELESHVNVNGSARNIDIMLIGENGGNKHKIAIELKCYRTTAASGKARGATDIFMKDVYYDLQLLEQYIQCSHAEEGVLLVMNDLKRFVYPKNKRRKCWKYDISHGAKCDPGVLSTPIGGKAVLIELTKAYHFEWKEHGVFWFLEIQGVS